MRVMGGEGQQTVAPDTSTYHLKFCRLLTAQCPHLWQSVKTETKFTKLLSKTARD
jgi:hypothetical protein